MLDDSQKSSALEQVKRELRSILLSAKSGVPLVQVKADYEMLSCNRLPFRDFGFRDIESFMRSMPDVAREQRMPDGELIYRAVCDDTTVHIQRLISNQNAPKRKKRGGGFSFRGRGGIRGGSGRGWRGGKKNFSSNSFRGGAAVTRLPFASRGGDRGRRGGGPLSRGLSSFSSSSSGDVRNTVNPGWSGDSFQSSSHQSFDRRSYGEDWDKENQVAPTPAVPRSLQIGVSKSGERTITTKQPDLRELLNANRARHASNESQHSQASSSSIGRGDTENNFRKPNIPVRRDANRPPRNNYMPKAVAPRFLRQQQESQASHRTAEDPSSNRNNNDYDDQPKKESTYEETKVCYTTASQNWLTTERGDEYIKAYKKFFALKGISEPVIEVVPGSFMTRKGFYGRLMYEGRMLFPLEILQTEEEARRNAARTFCIKNGISLPEEAVTSDKTRYEEMRPPSGTQTKPILARVSPPSVTTESITPLSPMSRDIKVEIAPSSPICRYPKVETTPSSPICRYPKVETTPSSSMSRNLLKVETAPPSPLSRDLKVKIYNIISPQGVFTRNLPQLFKETYRETLEQDSIDHLKDCPDFFNVEEPVPKRFIVYQVPSALDTISEATVSSRTDSERLQAKLPDVGTSFDAMFSFAYSADEIYIQKAESADVLYSIDDILANHCQASSLPDQVHMMKGSLICANYGGEWYRARVASQDGSKLSVYFIDYGNTEEVNTSDTRLLPQQGLVNETSALAIPCMARKIRHGDWCQNISEILTSISETCPFLKVEVKHHAGSVSIVDLFQSDGQNVNSMLMRRLSEDAAPISPALPSTPLPPQFPLLATSQFSSPSHFSSPSTKAAAQLLSYQVQSPNSQRMLPAKIFTEDPEPLNLPECESFGAFVCCVMSESSVFLRIVDDEYSGKLDELEAAMAEQFDQWSQPTNIHPSNVYACALPSEEEEEGAVSQDTDRYYRVRVLSNDDKNATCECYLLDHGTREIVRQDCIRHIDSALNTSLPYQAIYATLYGLDCLPTEHKVIATKILIRLTVTANVTFTAVRKDPRHNSAASGIGGIDKIVIDRVRKIISCMTNLETTKVATIYEDIFKEKLTNVEEIIKCIPGYGFWKHALQIELIDCSDEEEEDSSINNTIITLLQEIIQLKASGTEEEQALKDVLGSDSSSQADTTDSGSNGGDFNEPRVAVDGLSELSSSNNNITSESAKAPSDNGQQSGDASSSFPCDISQNALSVPVNHTRFLRNCPSIPPYIEIELDQFCAIYIQRSESPSYFVAMPYEQKQELTKLEQVMKDEFSKAPKVAMIFSKSCMYAVERDGIWRRTIYVGQIKHMHEVFYPDYHLFDTVTTEQLFVLPSHFYSLPLMARKMALGGVRPTSQDWSEAAKYWFIQNSHEKDMYGLVLSVDSLDPSLTTLSSMEDSTISGHCAHLPSLLYAQLVDTSEEEDTVLDQQLCEMGWARKVNF